MPKNINIKNKLLELEKEYGYTSSEVFHSYGKKDLDLLNIPKNIIMKWIHLYIVYNKDKLNLD